MNKYKLSVVSYYNTLPFIYGIQHSNYILENSSITRDYPSLCAEKLLNNQADIGLVPIAVLPKLKNYTILTDYCIGATDKVKTVILISEVPITEIKNIYLDYQSMTSVNLVKILAKFYWKINPIWQNAEIGYEKKISNTTAGLIIGDRVFDLHKNSHKYIYDLAYEWKQFTSLPFVFAVWTTNQDINQEYLQHFNEALRFGINEYKYFDFNLFENIKISIFELKKYLSENIDYHLDTLKKESMEKYFSLLSKI